MHNTKLKLLSRETGLSSSVVLFTLALGLFVNASVQAQGSANAEEECADPGASPTSTYRIGPGDVLDIFVWQEDDLSVTVPVRPDGRISIPLVEDVMAVDMTPTQLAREIEEVLSAFIRTPQVNVIVQDFVGTFGEQIRVLGQATNPGAIPFRNGMTLLDVIDEVGGITEFAAGNRSRISRVVDCETEEFRVRLDDLVNKGRLGENVVMRPGDVLVIPESIF